MTGVHDFDGCCDGSVRITYPMAMAPSSSELATIGFAALWLASPAAAGGEAPRGGKGRVVSLDRVQELADRESGLAVVFVGRSDGSGHASVVNAGVLDHPITSEPTVGFVAQGGARKLARLRARPRVTVVFRSGWEWVAVEGDAELVGPDDPFADLDPGDVAGLLRAVYAAAVGGAQDDWAELDSVMTAEGHTAVLIRPRRVYSNPGS